MSVLIFVFLMGLLGACIGWVTNLLAIKLLFRPYQAYQFLGGRIRIQGLLPRRQKELALALGEIVSQELLTGSDVLASLGHTDFKERWPKKVTKYVDQQVSSRMPFLLPKGVSTSLAKFIIRFLRPEINRFLDNPTRFLPEKELILWQKEIKKIIEKKVLSWELVELEKMTYALAHTELKHIEIVGALLGFLIGLFQGIIAFWGRSFF